MKWEDIEDMPHGELEQYLEQLPKWAALLNSAELKE